MKLCSICASVSGLWLVLSAGVAWGYLSATWLIPIALLMGGSVVGIAYQRHSMRWKATAIAIGMPLSYVLITRLTKTTVFIELIVLLAIAYAIFVKRNDTQSPNESALEEQMKQCC